MPFEWRSQLVVQDDTRLGTRGMEQASPFRANVAVASATAVGLSVDNQNNRCRGTSLTRQVTGVVGGKEWQPKHNKRIAIAPEESHCWTLGNYKCYGWLVVMVFRVGNQTGVSFRRSGRRNTPRECSTSVETWCWRCTGRCLVFRNEWPMAVGKWCEERLPPSPPAIPPEWAIKVRYKARSSTFTVFPVLKWIYLAPKYMQ